MLVVIVPSRGRPDAALQLTETVVDTRQVSTTRVVFAVDHDDPFLSTYRDVASVHPDVSSVEAVRGGWMVAALNEAATIVTSDPAVTAVGFMGDDHRPRTAGWDAAYLSALDQLSAGIVYGNDLLQYDFVPTQCAMTADIIRALGWMAHPTLKHMYVDTLWRDMGRAAGRLTYLPDVVVEHLHYLNNKSVEDDGYRRVNAPSVYQADELAFRALHASGIVRNAGETINYLARQAGK